MIDFIRNKLVSVARETEDIIKIHGVLDDSLYAMELDCRVHLKELTCLSIEGRMLRWTTPQCPNAISFLKEAEGFCLGPGIEDKINKTIGRRSCHHFASLMIDCAYAAQEAALLIAWQDAKRETPGLSLKDYAALTLDKSADDRPEKQERFQVVTDSREDTPGKEVRGSGKDTGKSLFPEKLEEESVPLVSGFMVDLHVHTWPASKCASSKVEDMIREARRIGLDALCVTDHNTVWSDAALEALIDKHGFQLFRGNEITTDQGDMLVFGFDEPVHGIIRLKELKQQVDRSGGFIIAAHPFRGFLTFGSGQLGLTPEKAMAREMFGWVHGIETLNGKVTLQENTLAKEVAAGLKLPATGGSDAHDVKALGIYATCFPRKFKTQAELIDALKEGQYTPVDFRGQIYKNQ